MADKKQEERETVRLTLAQSPTARPRCLVVNWQAGELLLYLENGTTLEAHAGPGKLTIEWAEGR